MIYQLADCQIVSSYLTNEMDLHTILLSETSDILNLLRLSFLIHKLYFKITINWANTAEKRTKLEKKRI